MQAETQIDSPAASPPTLSNPSTDNPVPLRPAQQRLMDVVRRMDKDAYLYSLARQMEKRIADWSPNHGLRLVGQEGGAA